MGIYVEMFGVFKGEISQEQVDQTANELVKHFGCEHFYLYDNKALEIADVIGIFEDEDVMEITPKEGERFLRLSLCGYFYTIGYERGNYPIYQSIAQWLESKLPSIEIYYGGDSVYPVPFTQELRDILREYYAQTRHKKYMQNF